MMKIKVKDENQTYHIHPRGNSRDLISQKWGSKTTQANEIDGKKKFSSQYAPILAFILLNSPNVSFIPLHCCREISIFCGAFLSFRACSICKFGCLNQPRCLDLNYIISMVAQILDIHALPSYVWILSHCLCIAQLSTDWMFASFP